jgi:hypothetical protein
MLITGGGGIFSSVLLGIQGTRHQWGGGGCRGGALPANVHNLKQTAIGLNMHHGNDGRTAMPFCHSNSAFATLQAN